jgi:hypothetical protein
LLETWEREREAEQRRRAMRLFADRREVVVNDEQEQQP